MRAPTSPDLFDDLVVIGELLRCTDDGAPRRREEEALM
jgi:hypothetical protein